MLRGWRSRVLKSLPDIDRMPEYEIGLLSRNSDVEHSRIFVPELGDNCVVLRPSRKGLSKLSLNRHRVDLGKAERFLEGRHVVAGSSWNDCPLSNEVERAFDQVPEVG